MYLAILQAFLTQIWCSWLCHGITHRFLIGLLPMCYICVSLKFTSFGDTRIYMYRNYLTFRAFHNLVWSFPYNCIFSLWHYYKIYRLKLRWRYTNLWILHYSFWHSALVHWVMGLSWCVITLHQYISISSHIWLSKYRNIICFIYIQHLNMFQLISQIKQKQNPYLFRSMYLTRY